MLFGLGEKLSFLTYSFGRIFAWTPGDIFDGALNNCNSLSGLHGDEIDNDSDGYVECLIHASGWDGVASVIAITAVKVMAPPMISIFVKASPKNTHGQSGPRTLSISTSKLTSAAGR